MARSTSGRSTSWAPATTTTTDISAAQVGRYFIGHTLPRGSEVDTVQLDGSPVTDYESRETNRGLEVRVATDPDGRHTLVVTTE